MARQLREPRLLRDELCAVLGERGLLGLELVELDPEHYLAFLGLGARRLDPGDLLLGG